MKIKYNWLILNIFILCILLGCMPLSVLASEINPVQPAYNGYDINDYNLLIKINKDRSLDVTENIEANFILPKHGIYRTIPLSGTMKYVKGSKINSKRYLAQVTDVKVRDKENQESIPFQIQTQNYNDYTIKIGDAKNEVVGTHSYQIQYHYSIDVDKSKKESFFTYNLIGTGWDTSIGNVKFQVTLPKELNKESVRLFSGVDGSKDTDRIKYNIDKNMIEGNVRGYLEPQEGVTLQLDIPPNYFENSKNNEIFSYVLIAFLLTGVLALFFAARTYYRKDSSFPQLFELTWNRTPAELSYMMDGNVTDRAIASMLIYWAEKGYIQLIEESKNVIRLKKNTEFMEEKTDCDKQLFYDIFKNRDSVLAKELGTDFYQSVLNYKRAVERDFQRQGQYLYDDKATKIALLTNLTSAGIITVMFGYLMNYFFLGIGGKVLTIVLCFFIAVIAILLGFVCKILVDAKKKGHFIIFLLGMGSYISFLEFLSLSIGKVMLHVPLFLFIMTCAILCILIGIRMNTFSKEGEKLNQEAYCYFNFLKEQMKTITPKESKQSLRIQYLSYFYLFGFSRKMTKMFRNIDVSPPDWYYSMRTSSIPNYYFLASMESGMNGFASVSSSSSDSGGSGGGSGGGGGGSW